MENNIIAFLDAGHGGPDPGAVKYVKEADVNIKVVNYACAYLNKHYTGVKVIKDISDDSINTVVARANKAKADLFVSVHFNAGGGDGYEALVYDKDNLKLAQCFEKHVKAVGQNSRGVKYRPDLGVLRLTNMKAILNEIAFVDNKKDISAWDEDKELKVMGEAIAKATAEWLKLKKKTSKPTQSASKSFTVKVLVPALNIRKTPGLDGEVVGVIRDQGVYTIVSTKKVGSVTWGKLKSGAGYISLSSKYVKKM